MFNQVYAKQVNLLLKVLPIIGEHDCFVLKGGSAINLFVQDMPRLSVDIDLTYYPLKERQEALTEISHTIEKIGQTSMARLPGVTVHQKPTVPHLVIRSEDAQIKIEPNTVFRGAVYSPQTAVLCEAAQDDFEQFLECSTLSTADLYGGKICAALDRQHPRDLFDIHLMFQNIGLTDEIRRAFVVYLAGSPRPMAELLRPNEQPLEEIFAKQFIGMTRTPVELNTLINARSLLMSRLAEELTENERLFLLSIKRGEPDWTCMPMDHLSKLPALRWKLQNINRMPKTKHQKALDQLRRILDV